MGKLLLVLFHTEMTRVLEKKRGIALGSLVLSRTGGATKRQSFMGKPAEMAEGSS